MPASAGMTEWSLPLMNWNNRKRRARERQKIRESHLGWNEDFCYIKEVFVRIPLFSTDPYIRITCGEQNAV